MTTGSRTTAASDADQGPVKAWVPADFIRLAALASVVAAPVILGWLGFALFFLVLGGTVLPRWLGTSGPVDAAYGAAIVFAAWAAQLEWYREVWWLDLVVHAVATGLVAVVAAEALVRWGALPAVDQVRPRRPVLGVALSVTVIGAALSMLWEFGEWLGQAYVDDSIYVGYEDTISDMALGVLGSAVAGVVAAAFASRRSTLTGIRPR